jgi:hypothetical protein
MAYGRNHPLHPRNSPRTADLYLSSQDRTTTNRIPRVGVHLDPATDELSVLHPALDPSRFNHDQLKWAGTPYSMEFADFINGWDLGKYRRDSGNGFVNRCFSLSLRKSKNIYNYAILNINNHFTPIGHELGDDMALLYRACMDYRRAIDEPIIPYESITFDNVHEYITKIDRIIMIGRLTANDLRMLRLLYTLHLEDVHNKTTRNLTNLDQALKNPDIQRSLDQMQEAAQYRKNTLRAAQSADLFLSSSATPQSQLEEDLELYRYPLKPDYRTYMDTAIFRNRPAQRRALDRLIMHGLIEITNIKRTELGIGTGGRRMAGAAITPIGKCFFDLYLATFDEKFQRLTANLDIHPTVVPATPEPFVGDQSFDIEEPITRQPTLESYQIPTLSTHVPSSSAPPVTIQPIPTPPTPTIHTNLAMPTPVSSPPEPDPVIDANNTEQFDRLTGRTYNINPKDFQGGLMGPPPEKEPELRKPLTQYEIDHWYDNMESMVATPEQLEALSRSYKEAREAQIAQSPPSAPVGQIEQPTQNGQTIKEQDESPETTSQTPDDSAVDHASVAAPSNKEQPDAVPAYQPHENAAQQPSGLFRDPYASNLHATESQDPHVRLQDHEPEDHAVGPQVTRSKINSPFDLDLDGLPTKPQVEQDQQ